MIISSPPLSARLLWLRRRHLPLDVLRHIWNGSGAVHQLRGNRASRGRCDTAHRANPSPDRHAPIRSSVPANCDPRPECKRSLPGHWSAVLLPLCAEQNSASSASASLPEHRPRAAADNRSRPVISISPTLSVVLFAQVDWSLAFPVQKRPPRRLSFGDKKSAQAVNPCSRHWCGDAQYRNLFRRCKEFFHVSTQARDRGCSG